MELDFDDQNAQEQEALPGVDAPKKIRRSRLHTIQIVNWLRKHLPLRKERRKGMLACPPNTPPKS